jgi:glycosyltransferase involved in cell wall biosynthesis
MKLSVTDRQRRSRRPKIVHLIVSGGHMGGTERVVIELASRPDETRADHCLALITPNPKLRALFADAGLRIHDRGPARENPVAYLWRTFGPRDVAWLEAVLKHEQADIVHVHTFGSHTLGVRAARRCDRSVIRTEHGIHHYYDPSCVLFRRWTLLNTDRVAAVSEFVANTIVDYAPSTRPRVKALLNGIDLDRYGPQEPPRSGPFTFSIISRLEPTKRVHLAIKAMSRLSGARLLIAGDGSQRSRLEALVRSLDLGNRVQFLGYRPDPRSVIVESDVTISCCNEEGLGLSVIEAAAMQRPSIAFDGGGSPEVVRDKETGWLVRVDTAVGLTGVMTEASLSRPCAMEYGRAARKWVEARFDVKQMCGQYADIYEELAMRRESRNLVAALNLRRMLATKTVADASALQQPRNAHDQNSHDLI